MPSAENVVVIRARTDRVRRWLLAAPRRVPLWWPEVVRIERLQGKRPPRFEYAYDLLGVRLRGVFTASTAPNALLIRTTQGPEIRVRIALVDYGDATSVAIRIDYVLPGALLGHQANLRHAERVNNEVLHSAMHRLKQILERTKPSARGP